MLNLMQTLKNVFGVFGNQKMIRFMPQCIWTAVSFSFFSGILVMVISQALDKTYGDTLTPDEKNEKAMIPMVIFGIGELFGG